MLGAHLQRLAEATRRIGLPRPNPDEARSLLDNLRSACPDGATRVRVAWNSESRWTVGAAPMSFPSGLADVVVDPLPRLLRDSIVAGTKTTNYCSASAFLSAHPSADEVLIVNDRGELCGGGYSNLFVAFGDSIVTPTLDSGARDGVTRSLLLQHLPSEGLDVRESVLRVEDLSRADEITITSTGRGVQQVGTLNGLELVNHHPLAERMAAVFEDLRERPQLWE